MFRLQINPADTGAAETPARVMLTGNRNQKSLEILKVASNKSALLRGTDVKALGQETSMTGDVILAVLTNRGWHRYAQSYLP